VRRGVHAFAERPADRLVGQDDGFGVALDDGDAAGERHDPHMFPTLCRQLVIRLSLRMLLSKARAGTMRRSTLTRAAIEPAG